jgi:hypothetical protein
MQAFQRVAVYPPPQRQRPWPGDNAPGPVREREPTVARLAELPLSITTSEISIGTARPLPLTTSDRLRDPLPWDVPPVCDGSPEHDDALPPPPYVVAGERPPAQSSIDAARENDLPPACADDEPCGQEVRGIHAPLNAAALPDLAPALPQLDDAPEILQQRRTVDACRTAVAVASRHAQAAVLPQHLGLSAQEAAHIVPDAQRERDGHAAMLLRLQKPFMGAWRNKTAIAESRASLDHAVRQMASLEARITVVAATSRLHEAEATLQRMMAQIQAQPGAPRALEIAG